MRARNSAPGETHRGALRGESLQPSRGIRLGRRHRACSIRSHGGLECGKRTLSHGVTKLNGSACALRRSEARRCNDVYLRIAQKLLDLLPLLTIRQMLGLQREQQ